MTKKADKKDRPTAQLFVYGQDAAGKPRGARFPATELDRVSPIVTAMNLKLSEGETEELVAIGMKLPVGRLHANGKAFIPNIRRDIYDRILALLGSSKSQRSLPPADTASTEVISSRPPQGDSSASTGADIASGLPKDWPSIAAGHMVLVQESREEGWWEAIVIAREKDVLTLRYRDFPKVPAFARHVASIAMLNPGPA